MDADRLLSSGKSRSQCHVRRARLSRNLGQLLNKKNLAAFALWNGLFLSSVLLVAGELGDPSQLHAAGRPDGKLAIGQSPQRVSSSSQQQVGDQQQAAITAELNNIVQQHGAFEDNNKEMAQYIISRLMYDNLTGSGALPATEADAAAAAQLEPDSLLGESKSAALETPEPVGEELQEEQAYYSGPTGLEALRLKKLISLLRNYEAMASGNNVFSPFPALPSSQAATMKRATTRLLQQQQSQQRPYGPIGYTRNSFDFGLGKRPDNSGSAGILRFGDSLGASAGGSMQPVSNFGKRPSAHRYDFGLGKRLASVSFPVH